LWENQAPLNYTGYDNVKFNQLFEKAVGEKNDSTRYQLYRKWIKYL
jgi:ABC-type transport system substrate-binding protein